MSMMMGGMSGMSGMGAMGSMGAMGAIGGMANRASAPGTFGSRFNSMRNPMTPTGAQTGLAQPSLQRPGMPPQNPLASMSRPGMNMPGSFGMAGTMPGKGMFSNTLGGGMGTLMGSSMAGMMGNMGRGMGAMPMGRAGK